MNDSECVGVREGGGEGRGAEGINTGLDGGGGDCIWFPSLYTTSTSLFLFLSNSFILCSSISIFVSKSLIVMSLVAIICLAFASSISKFSIVNSSGVVAGRLPLFLFLGRTEGGKVGTIEDIIGEDVVRACLGRME